MHSLPSDCIYSLWLCAYSKLKVPSYFRNALKTRKRHLTLLEKNFDIVHDGFIRLHVDRKNRFANVYSAYSGVNIRELFCKTIQVKGTNTLIPSDLALQAHWEGCRCFSCVLDVVYFSYFFIHIYIFIFFIYIVRLFNCFCHFSFNKIILHQMFTAFFFNLLNCVSNKWTFNKTIIQPSSHHFKCSVNKPLYLDFNICFLNKLVCLICRFVNHFPAPTGWAFSQTVALN